MRSRTLHLALGAAFALSGAAGAVRAQQPQPEYPRTPAQRPAQPAAQQRPAQPAAPRQAPAGTPQPYYSGPQPQPYPGQLQQAPYPAQTVPQRNDAEAPKMRFRQPGSDPNANPKRPSTLVETASSPSAAGRVQQVDQAAGKKGPLGPGQVEQLIQRSQGSIDFFEMVDDIMDEIARQLAREDPNLVSPMAIKLVKVSSNMRPEFAQTLQTRLIARLTTSTTVKVTMCAECTALRSRVEDGNWILALGAVNSDDLRRIGVRTGVKTFMELDFTYSPGSNVVWMAAVVYRASDGGVVWADAYRSDATMAALYRTGRVIPTRAERAAELEQKIAGRPNYGYALSLGVAQIGYAAPTGDIMGAQLSLRFHEKFGENQSNLFGMTAGIFTTGPPAADKTPQALNSILLGAYYSYNMSPPNLNRPEVWLYAEGGGMFSGNEGNTFYLESGLDTHLKWRLSLQGGLLYVLHTKFSGYDIGGVGFRIRAAMNW